MKKYLTLLCLPPLICLFLASALPIRVAAFDPFRPATDPGAKNTTVCDQKDPDGNPSPVCVVSGKDPLTGPDGVITKVVDIFALITGVAAIIIIMVSGFEYVRSSGDSSKVNKAKNGILFAVIGLVIVALARSIIVLAISKL